MGRRWMLRKLKLGQPTAFAPRCDVQGAAWLVGAQPALPQLVLELSLGQAAGQVAHLIAQRFHALTPLLGRIAELTTSRDFH